MQSKKLLYSILTGAFTAFVLTGCGATKPPTPSGIRIPVTEFAQQRQKEECRKKKKRNSTLEKTELHGISVSVMRRRSNENLTPLFREWLQACPKLHQQHTEERSQ